MDFNWLNDDTASADDVKVSKLLRRAQALEKIQQQILLVLPSYLHGHIRVANVRDRKLIIQTTNASWLTAIKLHQASLLDAAHECGVRCESIMVRIVPPKMQTQPTNTKKPFSESTQKLIDHIDEVFKST